MKKLSYQEICNDTIWIGELSHGGHIIGKYDEVRRFDEYLMNVAIADTDYQPEHLKEFYEGYFSQRKYSLVQDYYNNVYAKGDVLDLDHLNHMIREILDEYYKLHDFENFFRIDQIYMVCIQQGLTNDQVPLLEMQNVREMV